MRAQRHNSFTELTRVLTKLVNKNAQTLVEIHSLQLNIIVKLILLHNIYL